MSDQPDEQCTPAAALDKRSSFSLLRVLRIVVPVFLLGAACVVFFGFFDGMAWLADLMKPPLTHSTGQVLLNGEPLAHGEVRTKPATPGLAGAIGFLNELGEFELKTEIKGDFIDGAYPGEHKVTVTKYGMAQGPVAPLLVPQEYTSFATTPLTITISRDSADNKFPLPIAGEPASPTGVSAEEYAAANKEAGPDPADLASQVFEKLDANDDGTLSKEEVDQLDEELREAVRSADRNQDDRVGHQELYGVVSRSVDLFRKVVDGNDE
jgi:hypothetical protein